MGLQDNGVACDHRRRDFPRHERRRVVPRDDRRDNVDRHPLNPDLFVPGVRWQDLALDPARELGEVAEELRRAADLAARLGYGFTLLVHDDLDQRFPVEGDQVRDTAHGRRTLDRGQATPVLLGLPCRGECRLDLGSARFGHLGDHLPGCRAVNRPRVCCLLPLTADQQLQSVIAHAFLPLMRLFRPARCIYPGRCRRRPRPMRAQPMSRYRPGCRLPPDRCASGLRFRRARGRLSLRPLAENR